MTTYVVAGDQPWGGAPEGVVASLELARSMAVRGDVIRLGPGHHSTPGSFRDGVCLVGIGSGTELRLNRGFAS